MVKNKILEATNRIVALLEPLDVSDRQRVIQAALVVLGDQHMSQSTSPNPIVNFSAVPIHAPQNAQSGITEKQYFDNKLPVSKGEELAVAARYREEYLNATTSNKEEIRAIFKAARRNFDDKNFGRDLENARTKGLFNRGSGRDAVLSHYGQNYLDALPDRDAVNALRKPKGSGTKRATAKRTRKVAAKKAK